MIRANAPVQTENRIREIGGELWERMNGERPGVFNKGYWQGKLLDGAMSDHEFKINLFRLIDVLPFLKTNAQVSEHISEYLIKDAAKLPGFMSAAIKAASGGIGSGVAVGAFKKNVENMARQFIAGADAREAAKELKRLRKDGIGFTVDLLGEATLSDVEADRYQARYLKLVDDLADETANWKPNPTLDRDDQGEIPRANVSLKVSALAPNLDAVHLDSCVERLFQRVMPIALRAKERGVFINFDMEQWALHPITFALFEAVALSPELCDWTGLGIAVQAYTRASKADLKRMLKLAQERGAPITVRLVKGAYWDYEVVRARQDGLPCPVFTDKAATDAQYENLTRYLLDHYKDLRPALGTHNLRSTAHAMAAAEERGVPKAAIEFQTLYGMAEPERKAMAALGWRVRAYLPLGNLLPGMAYLVRRLLENTANAWFLKLTHHDGVDLDRLLAPPVAPTAPFQENDKAGFMNCSFLDFTKPAIREGFAAAVQFRASALPLPAPVVINCKTNKTGPTFERPCPAYPDRVATTVSLATRGDVDRAVESAHRAWPAWRDTPLEERAACLERLADILEADRMALAATQTFEVAKPWREADADVAEAIDFCRYYARRARVELAPTPQGDIPGEINTLVHEGRGVTVAIAPWNFPLAILAGMSAAALVAGCPVVLKPAEQSSGVAYELFERMMRAGFPKGVVQFLPGVGEEVGPQLVRHPLTANIAFTGSRAVGLEIWENAAKKTAASAPGQTHLKRVVCEMGGKNAIIVDADADLDEAVRGVIKSAFGYAGQKCSACSRVLVVGDIYESFIARLRNATATLGLGPADSPDCEIPPVVDAEARDRLIAVIENPGEGAQLIFKGAPPQTGFYVPPTVFEVDDKNHRLMTEEFFGPVLALMRVETFDAALEVANATNYALTGAVFSRTPSHLERAAKTFRVGNLYLNRGSTGAMVDRNPFGGFGMSGGGTKAVDPDYLKNFTDPRVVTENTMRQGFTPEISG